jgi:hypothetical protein
VRAAAARGADNGGGGWGGGGGCFTPYALRVCSTNGDNFYVVESGEFDIFVNGNKV